MSILRNARLGAKPALILPQRWNHRQVSTETVVSFGELCGAAEAFRRGFGRWGLEAGDRVVVLVPPGADTYALVVAAAAEGIASVLLDPQMGVGGMRWALASAAPKAIVSIRRVLRLSAIVPELRSIPLRFCAEGAGRSYRALDELRSSQAPDGGPQHALDAVAPVDQVATAAGPSRGELVKVDDDALAMLAFTTGSTGLPKGVARTLRTLVGTCNGLDAEMAGGVDDVVLSVFPAFALYFLLAGRTVVLPPARSGHPGGAPPAAVVDLATRAGVASLVAPPALLSRLVEHTAATGERIPTLGRVWTGGAPVPGELVERVLFLWPDVEARVLYGSTEAEPISSVGFAEVASSQNGRDEVAGRSEGFLVGREAPPTAVAVVEPIAPGGKAQRPDDPLVETLPAGAVGEILVAGPQVVENYWRDPGTTRQLKVRDVNGRVWHRTGDTGYRDDQGGLWLTGRIADLVTFADGRVVQPLSFEQDVDLLPGVGRSALVAHARAPHGEVLVEVVPGARPERVCSVVRDHLRAAGVDVPVAVVATVAMDRRHNSKIDRPALRRARERPLARLMHGAQVARGRATAAQLISNARAAVRQQRPKTATEPNPVRTGRSVCR